MRLRGPTAGYSISVRAEHRSRSETIFDDVFIFLVRGKKEFKKAKQEERHQVFQEGFASGCTNLSTLSFMHLAVAFIQSDLQVGR